MKKIYYFLITAEVILGLLFMYFAYQWLNTPESGILEPKTVFTGALASINGLFLKYFPKKWEKDKPCPFDEKILHENQEAILYATVEELEKELFEKFNINLKNKLLIEKNGENEILLPAIILTQNEVTISSTLSETIDNNPINKDFINTLRKQCGHRIWENPTYRLMNIAKNTNELSIGESSYFQTLSTCDIHYYNFMDKTNHMINGKGKEYNNWFTKLRDIIIYNQFSSVSASLGCSTLLMLKNPNTKIYEYYIVDNSKVKNAKSTKHVIPAFMFQPTKKIKDEKDFRLQSDLTTQILKEFGEELLGLEKLEEINDYEKLQAEMNKNKVLRRLRTLLKEEKAMIKTLGVSLDVYRLRPEILTILIIDDEKFFKQFNKSRTLSWEASEIGLDGLMTIDVNDEQAYLDLIFNKEKPLVSPGAACLKLGRDFMINEYLQ
jgi:hypothetical protein